MASIEHLAVGTILLSTVLLDMKAASQLWSEVSAGGVCFEVGGAYELWLEVGGVYKVWLEVGRVYKVWLEVGGVYEVWLEMGGV